MKRNPLVLIWHPLNWLCQIFIAVFAHVFACLDFGESSRVSKAIIKLQLVTQLSVKLLTIFDIFKKDFWKIICFKVPNFYNRNSLQQQNIQIFGKNLSRTRWFRNKTTKHLPCPDYLVLVGFAV